MCLLACNYKWILLETLGFRRGGLTLSVYPIMTHLDWVWKEVSCLASPRPRRPEIVMALN